MTRIPAELDLAGAGFEYVPMEPFASTARVGGIAGSPGKAAALELLKG